jgi:hypothetical protein
MACAALIGGHGHHRAGPAHRLTEIRRERNITLFRLSGWEEGCGGAVR